jgi:hypothetical protein
MHRWYRLIGSFLLAVLMFWNVWVVESFLSSDGELSAYTRGWIWLSDIVLVAVGLLLVKYERKAVINLVLVSMSFLVALGLFELVLRSGLLDDRTNPHPVWVPAKYKEAKQEVAQATAESIQRNPLQFNDIPRTEKKGKGHSRIAVIGDSFIQAWRTPYDEIWSHRIEKRIQEHFNNIEVLSWGKSGWSTLDELNFLKEHGTRYEIDLVIVGFAINDPDLGTIDTPHRYGRYLVWQYTKPVMPFRLLFPNVLDYFAAHINLLLHRYVLQGYGYENWITKIYSDKNLKEYEKILKEFSEFCSTKHIGLLFVLTPNDYDPSNKDLFDRITPLLRAANIEYLDLYPAVYDRLHSYPQRQLWVTLGDSHPGPLVTEVLADEVFQYLKTTGRLRQLSTTASEKA